MIAVTVIPAYIIDIFYILYLKKMVAIFGEGNEEFNSGKEVTYETLHKRKGLFLGR